ncbi:hypothetical protein [Nonomuraea diastatica]|uniref:hypothetical protein n=1 Tax=Nonomuraea diastatica TaxID=1848329 RepID=UPI001FE7D5B7|nr:hypothetical protein [Nonomuraea diastatica]
MAKSRTPASMPRPALDLPGGNAGIGMIPGWEARDGFVTQFGTDQRAAAACSWARPPPPAW